MSKFDAATGGHLILWDLKLIIDFPAGSTILIPSATLTHSNTPVASHESRFSFTQYCAGPILQFVDQGFQTESQLKVKDPAKYKEFQASKPDWWRHDMEYLSVMDDLLECIPVVDH